MRKRPPFPELEVMLCSQRALESVPVVHESLQAFAFQPLRIQSWEALGDTITQVHKMKCADRPCANGTPYSTVI
jgi:hypothetical protein